MDLKELRRILEESMDPDRFACKIRYRASDGEVTDRFISPIRFPTGHTVLALCFGQLDCRQFTLSRIIAIRQMPASDCQMPTPIVVVSPKPEAVPQ